MIFFGKVCVSFLWSLRGPYVGFVWWRVSWFCFRILWYGNQVGRFTPNTTLLQSVYLYAFLGGFVAYCCVKKVSHPFEKSSSDFPICRILFGEALLNSIR